jgi:hypothetical protein
MAAVSFSIPPGQGLPNPPINIPPGQGLLTLPVPTISALSPNTGPANADITVDITGTGFDSSATVNIGTAHMLVPISVTPTDLHVLIKAINITQAGVLPVSVQNAGPQVSNQLNFTVT